MSKKIEVEIISEHGDEMVKPVSAVEYLGDIKGYNDLVRRISTLDISDNVGYGDGKAYDWGLGQSIWKSQIVVAKPVVATTEAQKNKLESIYKFLYHCVQTGEYPLMQMLCNYLGITLDELMMSLSDVNNQYRDIYLWVYRLFESTANMNSLKSNGNFAARKWIDESREHKVSADVQLTTAIERQRIDVLSEFGRELLLEFMVEDDEDE